jgi:hypothetical protein
MTPLIGKGSRALLGMTVGRGAIVWTWGAALLRPYEGEEQGLTRDGARDAWRAQEG